MPALAAQMPTGIAFNRAVSPDRPLDRQGPHRLAPIGASWGCWWPAGATPDLSGKPSDPDRHPPPVLICLDPCMVWC